MITKNGINFLNIIIELLLSAWRLMYLLRIWYIIIFFYIHQEDSNNWLTWWQQNFNRGYRLQFLQWKISKNQILRLGHFKSNLLSSISTSNIPGNRKNWKLFLFISVTLEIPNNMTYFYIFHCVYSETRRRGYFQTFRIVIGSC